MFSWELEFGEWEKWGGGRGKAEGCPRSPVGASSRGCRLVPGLRGALDPPFLPPGSSLTPFQKTLCFVVPGWSLFLLPAMKNPTWDMWLHLFLLMCLLSRHSHPQCEVQGLQENPGHPCPAISPQHPQPPLCAQNLLLASLPSWKEHPSSTSASGGKARHPAQVS